MVWRVSKIDPTTNVAAEAVLKAFEAARGSGLPSVECYRAGVEASRRQHPDQTAEYTAKQAGAVSLATHARIRVWQNLLVDRGVAPPFLFGMSDPRPVGSP